MSNKAKKAYLNACISRAARSIQDGDANAVWVYVTVGCMPNEKLYLTLRSRPDDTTHPRRTLAEAA